MAELESLEPPGGLRTLVLAGLAFATGREHATRRRGAGATQLSGRGRLEARGARGTGRGVRGVGRGR